jgi:hypothetical protein
MAAGAMRRRFHESPPDGDDAMIRLMLSLVMLLMLVPVARAQDPLSFVPPTAEMVFSINARQVAQSPLFARVVKEIGGPQAEGGLVLLKNMTGTDFTRDIDRIHLWGRMQDDASVALHIKGRLNQENLVALAKMNKGYRTGQVQGATVHQWTDEGSGMNRYGTFLGDGSLLVANSLGAMEQALGANRQQRSFLQSASAKKVPADADSAGIWGMVLRPERALGDTNMQNLLHASAAFLRANLGAQQVDVRTRVFTDSAQRAAQWQKMVEGMFAFAQLQEENAMLATLAERASVSPATGDSTAVDVAFSLTNDEVVSFLREQAAK